MNVPPVFVVGTGRCGSTLVSQMLARHPTVLSLSELFSLVSDFGMRIPQAFEPGELSGARFWEIVGGTYPRQSLLLKHGLVMDEVIYPFGPRARYTHHTGAPAIAQALLPLLSDDPDALYDALAAEVVTWPAARVADHYRHFAATLARRYGRSRWAERSGGGLRIVNQLVAHFPDARFLHVARDGRNCALSIAQHDGFRMALVQMQTVGALGYDPFETADRAGVDALSPELARLLPESFSREAFLAYEVPTSFAAQYWSGEVAMGVEALAGLPAERVHHMRYEDFFDDPAGAVRALGDFVGGEAPEGWVEGCVRRIRAPRSRWESLPDDARGELRDACALGFQCLEAVGLRWPA